MFCRTYKKILQALLTDGNDSISILSVPANQISQLNTMKRYKRCMLIIFVTLSRGFYWFLASFSFYSPISMHFFFLYFLPYLSITHLFSLFSPHSSPGLVFLILLECWQKYVIALTVYKSQATWVGRLQIFRYSRLLTHKFQSGSAP